MRTNVGAFFPLPETPLTDGEATRLIRKLARYATGSIPTVLISRKVRCTRGLGAVVQANPEAGWRWLVYELAWGFFTALNSTRPTEDEVRVLESKLVREVYKRKYLDGRLKDKPKAPPTKKQKQSAAHKRVLASMKQWEAKRKRAVNALKKLEKKRKYYQRVLDEHA